MRKLGINFGSYPNLEAEEFAKIISSAGFGATFTGVKDAATHDKYAQVFAKYNIAYETIHAPFGHINDIWLDTLDGEEMSEELKFSIDRCRQVGAPVLVVHLSSGKNPPPVTDIGGKRFTELVEYADKNGIDIAFENQRMLFNIEWAFETFKDSDNVGFCWDCGHEGCFTPDKDFMELFGDKLICTHIHDNFCEYDKDLHLLPFDGRIDFQRVARNIKQSGFKGSIMLETITSNSDLYVGMAAESYMSKAVEAAKKILDMVEK